MGLPEEDLIRKAQAGTHAAFDELVRLHRDFIIRSVGRRVGNDEVRDEVVQKTFIRAFTAIGSFRAESAFSTWLYRIAMNTLSNHLRDERSHATVGLDEVTLLTNALKTAKLVAREMHARLGGAITQLSPKQRRVVELRLIDELAFKEIAIVMESTEETARQNFALALKKLRAILQPTSDG